MRLEPVLAGAGESEHPNARPARPRPAPVVAVPGAPRPRPRPAAALSSGAPPSSRGRPCPAPELGVGPAGELHSAPTMAGLGFEQIGDFLRAHRRAEDAAVAGSGRNESSSELGNFCLLCARHGLGQRWPVKNLSGPLVHVHY